MNVRTEVFKAEHMIAISDSIIEKTFTPDEWRMWAEYNNNHGIALTAFVDDKIMACGGLKTSKTYTQTKRWKRKNRPDKIVNRIVYGADCTMWVVIHESAANHKREMFYAAKVFIELLTEDIKTDTIKCQVCVGFDAGHRFVQHLGFKSLDTQDTLGFDDYELTLERAA